MIPTLEKRTLSPVATLLAALLVGALALAAVLYHQGNTALALAVILPAGIALVLALALGQRLARQALRLTRTDEQLASMTTALSASEKRLALFMAQSSDGIWEWTPATDHWFFSPSVPALLGYQDRARFEREFDFWHHIHADDQERVLEFRRAYLEKQDGSCDLELRLRGPDGYRWFRCRAADVPGEEGQARRLAGILSDISQVKSLEQDLSASLERQAAAVQALSEGLWNWDLERKRFTYSRRFSEMLGYEEGNLPASQEAYLELVHPDDRPRVTEAWQRHFREKRPYDDEHRLLMADGNYHWFRTRGQAVWDEDGQVRSFSAAVNDITLHRRAMDSIRTLLAENQALLDNALMGIAQTRNQVFVSCNRRFEEMFGYSYGELVDKPMDILFPSPAEADVTWASALPALARGERFTVETELRKSDGGNIWCLLSGHAAEQEHPEDGSIWVFADLSQQQRAMAAVRRERDFSNALIDHLPGVFCLLDQHRRIIRWNANFELQSGYSAREILQITWESLFPGDQREAAERLMHEVWNTGAASGQIALLSKSGEHKLHLFNGVQVEVDGEDNLALLGMDITEREEVAEQIRALNADLERRVGARTMDLEALNKELVSFSYSVSHDLSTPLRTVEGFARILETDYGPALDDLARNYLARIRGAALRMQQLIDDLLALSRASRNEMRSQPCDLAAIARPILADLHYQNPRRSVTEDIPAQLLVTGDQSLLTIVMENLLRNAWKFTSRHQTAHIEVGQLDKNGEPVYFVRDDGAGFDMLHASRLFGTFQRLHHGSEFPGTGIGLAIVARIIARHGGRIWADAAIDQGATFYFTLPREPSHVQ